MSCLKRPKRQGKNRWQSYCRECHAEFVRTQRAERKRAGWKRVYVSPAEWELLQASRLAPPAPAGRHHASQEPTDRAAAAARIPTA